MIIEEQIFCKEQKMIDRPTILYYAVTNQTVMVLLWELIQ